MVKFASKDESEFKKVLSEIKCVMQPPGAGQKRRRSDGGTSVQHVGNNESGANALYGSTIHGAAHFGSQHNANRSGHSFGGTHNHHAGGCPPGNEN